MDTEVSLGEDDEPHVHAAEEKMAEEKMQILRKLEVNESQFTNWDELNVPKPKKPAKPLTKWQLVQQVAVEEAKKRQAEKEEKEKAEKARKAEEKRKAKLKKKGITEVSEVTNRTLRNPDSLLEDGHRCGELWRIVSGETR